MAMAMLGAPAQSCAHTQAPFWGHDMPRLGGRSLASRRRLTRCRAVTVTAVDASAQDDKAEWRDKLQEMVRAPARAVADLFVTHAPASAESQEAHVQSQKQRVQDEVSQRFSSLLTTKARLLRGCKWTPG